MSKLPEPRFKVGAEVVNTKNHSKGVVEKVKYEPVRKTHYYNIYYEFAAAGKVKLYGTEWRKIAEPYSSYIDVPDYDLGDPEEYTKP